MEIFAQWLVDRGLAPISRVRTIAAIKSLFSFCSRTRYIPLNPALELAFSTYEKRLSERIVAEADVQRLLGSPEGNRDRVLVQLLYTAGVEFSEACGYAGGISVRTAAPGRSQCLARTDGPVPSQSRSIDCPTWSACGTMRFGGSCIPIPQRQEPGSRTRLRDLRRAAEQAGIAAKVSPPAPPRSRVARPRSRGPDSPGPSNFGPQRQPPPARTCTPVRGFERPVSKL